MSSVKNNYNETHEKGTYVNAKPIQANRDELFKWVQDNGITNALNPSEYHTTVIYSKKPCPDVKGYDFNLPINAEICGWKIFDAGIGRCLVAELESQDLQTINADLKDQYGATSDFDNYIPHITVSYNYVGDSPTSHPKMKVWFNKVEVKGIDPDWKPSK